MNTQELKQARNAAFDAYVAVKKAGGKSPLKLARLKALTVAHHRAMKRRSA